MVPAARPIAPFFLAVVLLSGLSASAAPRGNYTDAPDRLSWFMVVADSHIGQDFAGGSKDTDRLKWVAGGAFQLVNPLRLVNLGDLVDGTDGGLVPKPPQHDDEWQAYRAIVDEHGMTTANYLDLCGNHDTYWEKGHDHYLAYSVQGSADGQTQHSQAMDTAGGRVHLLATDTTCEDGGAWPIDNADLNDAERAFIANALDANADADVLVALGHHPLDNVAHSGEFLDLLSAHGAIAYLYGHTHDSAMSWQDGILHANVASLAKSGGVNVAILAVDDGSFALRLFEVGHWPWVLTTAPADATLGGDNPYAYIVPRGWSQAPVRALVFSDPAPTAVEFRVDEGPWTPMASMGGPVWQGTMDATTLELGYRRLRVRAQPWTDSEDRHETYFRVLDRACSNGKDDDGDGLADLEDPDCTGPADNDEKSPALPPEPSPEPAPEAPPEPAPEPVPEPVPEVEDDLATLSEEVSMDLIPNDANATVDLPSVDAADAAAFDDATPVSADTAASVETAVGDTTGADPSAPRPVVSSGGCAAGSGRNGLPATLALAGIALALAAWRRRSLGRASGLLGVFLLLLALAPATVRAQEAREAAPKDRARIAKAMNDARAAMLAGKCREAEIGYAAAFKVADEASDAQAKQTAAIQAARASVCDCSEANYRKWVRAAGTGLSRVEQRRLAKTFAPCRKPGGREARSLAGIQAEVVGLERSARPRQSFATPRARIPSCDGLGRIRAEDAPDAAEPSLPADPLEREEYIQGLEKFIERNAQHVELAPEAIYCLAEARYEEAEEAYLAETAEYERAYDQWVRGDKGPEPKDIVPDLGRAIAGFRRIVEEFPKWRHADAAAYALSYSLHEMLEDERAATELARFQKAWPASKLTPEAVFLLGETSFAAGRFREAADAYRNVIATPASPHALAAAYKLVWSLYRGREIPAAIRAFGDLADRIASGAIKGDPAPAVRDEAIECLGNWLADPDWNGDGKRDPDATAQRALDLMKDHPFEREVIEHYVDALTATQDATLAPMAIEANRALLQRDPLNAGNYPLAEKVIDAYDRMADADKMVSERLDFVKRFGPGSAWSEAHRDDPQLLARVDRSIESNLLQAAQFLYLRTGKARTGEGARDAQPSAAETKALQAAAAAYEDFLKRYPRSENAPESWNLLGELRIALSRFLEAADAYRHIRDWNADTVEIGDAERREASRLVLDAVDREVRRRQADGAKADTIPSFLGGPLPDVQPGATCRDSLPPVVAEWIVAADGCLTRGCLDNRQSASAGTALAYRVAGELYQRGCYKDARSRLEKVADAGADDTAYFAALGVLGICKSNSDKPCVDTWFAKARKLKLGAK